MDQRNPSSSRPVDGQTTPKEDCDRRLAAVESDVAAMKAELQQLLRSLEGADQ